MPGMNAPAALQFSPDGRLLTYLWSEAADLVRQIWAYDTQTHERRLFARAPGEGDTDATVSAEEALRRERLRMRGSGITSYAWAERANICLIPLLGEVYLTDAAGSLRKIETGGAVTDPRLDPEGRALAFVRDGELWSLNLE